MSAKVDQTNFDANNAELRKSHSVVQIISEAGYRYEQKSTHANPHGNLDFFKPLGEKYFPHFHLIYDPSKESISIHLDKREHRASNISADSKDELERLYSFFSKRPTSLNPETNKLASTLSRTLLNLATFGNEEETHRVKQKRTFVTIIGNIKKRQKLKKGSRKKYLDHKYSQTEADEN